MIADVKLLSNFPSKIRLPTNALGQIILPLLPLALHSSTPSANYEQSRSNSFLIPFLDQSTCSGAAAAASDFFFFPFRFLVGTTFGTSTSESNGLGVVST